jgi:hypothetical protein
VIEATTFGRNLVPGRDGVELWYGMGRLDKYSHSDVVIFDASFPPASRKLPDGRNLATPNASVAWNRSTLSYDQRLADFLVLFLSDFPLTILILRHGRW